MYFEAKVQDKHFEVTVNETRSQWDVALREKNKDNGWHRHKIDKSNFQSLEGAISLIYKNSSYLIDVVGAGTEYTVYTRGAYRTIQIYNEELLLHESLKAGDSFGSNDNLSAGMPGKVVKVFVEAGQKVKKNEPLLIMEAMKMENEMRASQDCKIKAIHAHTGDNVEAGFVLISFE